MDIILQKEKIQLSIEDLIQVFENLKYLQIESINLCLEQDPQQWKQLSMKLSNQEQSFELQVSNESLMKMYNEKTEGQNNPVSIQIMQQVSQYISEQCVSYSHNQYQCTISSILSSIQENFIIAIIPTGSGKTWIQGLLAKLYCQQGKSVSIIEPTDQLQMQTSEKVGPIDYRITIATIQWYFKYHGKDDVIILDEFDEIITNYSYHINNNKVEGIWSFIDKKVIAFSATSNQALEKFVNNSIIKPYIVKLPSEYELIHGISSLQLGNIKCSNNFNEIFAKFSLDLEKIYESKPIIIIAHNEQIQMVQNFLVKNKLRHLIGASENNLTDIRGWDYGVLVIEPADARGLDTRFAKDSFVQIIANVENELQYQQLIGRASRTRGLSEGVLYIATLEQPNNVIQRLRKQNFTKYQELEHLVNILQKNSQNQGLIKVLLKAKKEGLRIHSLEDINKVIGERAYIKLMKDIIV